MGRVRRIARRSFLIGSAAVVGGVAFGVWQVSRPVENPLRPERGATLNPFVIVDGDGVTVIAPRAEMGQGIHTTLAALVAEELDVEMSDLRVLHGPPAQAYYNSALLRGELRYHPEGLGGWRRVMADALGAGSRVLRLQVTGGSTSTLDGYVRMRTAGATAREALKEAAAQAHGLPRDRLATDRGHVILPDGTRIPYGDLAEAAAAVEVPEVALRPASEWRLLGRSQPRVDAVAKSTGTARYAIDVRLPGMRFATVRMCPHPRGGMARFDAARAEAMSGVDKVIDLGTGIAVVAHTTWQAMEAARAVEITWTPGPGPQTTADAFAEIEAAFDTRRNARPRDDGDVDAALEGADALSVEYRVPFLHHTTMEPMGAAALFDPAAGDGPHLTLWSGNQAPILHRDKAAEAVDLPPEAVTLHTPMMGGGFGRRAEFDFTVLAARVAQAAPGTPVQVTWSREEDMRHGFYRPGAIARMRGAVTDGRVEAFDAKVAAPSVMRQSSRRFSGFAPPGPDRAHLEGIADQPYGFASCRVEGYLCETALPVGFWRAVGNSFNGFFHECFVDELAHAAGADPLAFRLAHLDDAPSRAVLEAVAEMSDWTGATPDGIGRGVAITRSFGTPVAQVVEVADDGGGVRITRAWVACDVGRALDPAIIAQQMEGGLIQGLSAAAYEEITFDDGQVVQGNFPDYTPMRLPQGPRVAVRILESGGHMGGAGEPATPPAMPALANAVFDLTGRRLRELPLARHIRFAV
ncbi:xanthine dehydrogenase family protein molybdopterin-binding subunit [Rhodobaculum claviforme]|uniref:Isoquinoline 1-oxidoreductase n=1 Tax=Rhodobaculum claviforme TaxID=1549854 RepID=A0A934TM62_9RHOB|nr:molybdopterin cofactor-binding domain-containing protein [Rhodobaculum claviforme]MBK5927702.1 isoquinoline 1-oxidoreductase [Rhodobaculum claviforme]